MMLALIRRLLAPAALLLLVVQPAHAGTLTLEWDPPADSTIVGYTVFYGTTPGNYTASIPAGSQTICTIDGLTDGVTYYFAVQAIDPIGKPSPLPNEVSGAPAPPDTTPDAFSFAS